MSAAGARGGLSCKWIVSIKSHSAAGTNWIASSLRRFFFQPPTSCWVTVVKRLTASLLRQKKKSKRQGAGCLIMKDPFFQEDSAFLFCVWAQADTCRNTEGTKLSEICPASTVDPCQSIPHFLNEVGRARCLARYNYTTRLSLSARDNGR